MRFKGMYDITLIPGDGIGPEVTEAAVKVVKAAGVKMTWHARLAGQAAVREVGSPLPHETIDSILGAMMLERIGEGGAAEEIRQAVGSVLEGRSLTPDIGGHSTALETTQGIIGNLA